MLLQGATLIIESQSFLSGIPSAAGKTDMCLAIPMQIENVNGYTARCQAKGIYRDVSLFMMQDELPQVGDYVMVHVCYAIQKVTETEARSAWELYDQILAETGEAGCALT